MPVISPSVPSGPCVRTARERDGGRPSWCHAGPMTAQHGQAWSPVVVVRCRSRRLSRTVVGPRRRERVTLCCCRSGPATGQALRTFAPSLRGGCTATQCHGPRPAGTGSRSPRSSGPARRTVQTPQHPVNTLCAQRTPPRHSSLYGSEQVKTFTNGTSTPTPTAPLLSPPVFPVERRRGERGGTREVGRSRARRPGTPQRAPHVILSRAGEICSVLVWGRLAVWILGGGGQKHPI